MTSWVLDTLERRTWWCCLLFWMPFCQHISSSSYNGEVMGRCTFSLITADALACGFSCMLTLVPGAAMGVLLKSSCSCRCASDEWGRFTQKLCNRWSIGVACGISMSHRWMGKSGSMPARPYKQVVLPCAICASCCIALVCVCWHLLPCHSEAHHVVLKKVGGFVL